MGNTNELSAEDYPQLWLMLDKLHLDLMVQQIRAVHRNDGNKARDYRRKLEKVESVMSLVDKDYGHFRKASEPVAAKKQRVVNRNTCNGLPTAGPVDAEYRTHAETTHG